jgi:hypothetical protein
MKNALLTVLAASALTFPAFAEQPAGPAIAQQPADLPVDLVAKLRDAALKDDVAWDIVKDLTTEIGPRPDGSPQEARARDWAVATLKSLGFKNVHIEPYKLNTWVRGLESAEVESPYPQPLRVTALGNSGATPPGGLLGPVVFFRSLADLRTAPDGSLVGQIAFVSNSMQPTMDGSSYGSQGQARRIGPNIAAKKGAIAIVIRSIGTDHGRGPHAGVTNFEPGVTPIPAAALSIADAENLERMVTMPHDKPVMLHLLLTPKQVGLRDSGNVVAEVPGTDPSAGVILIGGHLDSWDLGTGAIDDGSGVAITTAAAKLLMESGKHKRTIRVVWFGDEETGGFGGAAYAKAHAGERHAIAAESDFGADRVWRFQTNLPDNAKGIADRLAAALDPIGVIRGAVAAGEGTDVEPTIATGVASINLNQNGLRYFDWHHTPEDILDRIDPEQLRQNVAAWTAMLAILADAPEDLGPVSIQK